MTKAALDPVGKIQESKYCAVAIRRAGARVWQGDLEARARNSNFADEFLELPRFVLWNLVRKVDEAVTEGVPYPAADDF